MRRHGAALHILQINRDDELGGAAQVARSLMKASESRGHLCGMAGGSRSSGARNVFTVPREEVTTWWSGTWTRFAEALDGHGHWRGCARMQQLCRQLGRSPRQRHLAQGKEDFDHPGSWRVLEVAPWKPDIVHLHNVHGKYFDLRSLPALTAAVPTVMTLHDAWLLGGHCAHSLDCERWRVGCGRCPYPNVPLRIQRDATRYNWSLKRRIYRHMSVRVATPCHWLMSRVEQSILQPGIVEQRVINNGVDLSLHHPAADPSAVRDRLGLPAHAFILLMSSLQVRRNAWKDHKMLLQALQYLGGQITGREVMCLALGAQSEGDESVAGIQVRYVPYCYARERVAQYYQAADVYVHPARVDTFPNAILEALASGIPVVATAVGGIPEQVRSAWALGGIAKAHGDATGILVAGGDAKAMAAAILGLAQDESQRLALGRNAVSDARQRFDLEQCVDAYLDWYEEILDVEKPEAIGG